MRSLVFETPPLDTPIEILGAAIVTLDVASDRPIANLAVRLCDVHPSGESLRVSYGVLNLTHRDGHEKPAPLAIRRTLPGAYPAQRCGLGVPSRPQGKACPIHGLLADDLAKSREGDAADFRVAHSICRYARPRPQTRCCRRCLVPSRRHLRSRRGSVAVICVSSASTASAWNWARESKSRFHVEEDDPLSAVAELRRTQTMSRDAWQIRIETQMRLSCTRNAFLLQGSLRAWEGANEVCRREWDRSIPRDFI